MQTVEKENWILTTLLESLSMFLDFWSLMLLVKRPPSWSPASKVPDFFSKCRKKQKPSSCLWTGFWLSADVRRRRRKVNWKNENPEEIKSKKLEYLITKSFFPQTKVKSLNYLLICQIAKTVKNIFSNLSSFR